MIIALYADEKCEKLLDVKCYDLAKTQTLTDTFIQSGYGKAFWWSSLFNIMPLLTLSAYIINELVDKIINRYMQNK